jgi:peptide-methionine (S)-S-oxide reductase
MIEFNARRLVLAALLLASCGQGAADSAGAPVIDTAVQQQLTPRPPNARTALFAGGCFWSAERDVEAIPGVVDAVSGFAGGSVRNPSYRQVARGGTGHLEAIQVTYDPARISYARLVRRFLRTIDPTDRGGQYCDRGDDYRTAIFALDAGQRRDAEAAVAEANGILRGGVVTPVRGPATFYPAEAWHQDFARRHPALYARYRAGCGKDARLREVWGAQAPTH